jgi:hypothetical protein
MAWLVWRAADALLFGVARRATARFSPFAIYNEEMVIGSMAVLHSFGRAVEALAAEP